MEKITKFEFGRQKLTDDSGQDLADRVYLLQLKVDEIIDRYNELVTMIDDWKLSSHLRSIMLNGN